MKISREVNEKYNFLKPFEFCNLVRFGKVYDGGYIVPEKIIKESDGLISFGYGYDPSFEYDYIKNTGNKVHIYDYTCNSYYLIKLFLKYIKRFLLFRKKLKDVIFHYKNLKDHIIFFRHKKINYQKKKIVTKKLVNSKTFVSTYSAGEIPLIKSEITIDQIFSKIDFKKIIFKCDIEGSEYLIMDDLLKYHDRIDVMIFEFHWVDKNLKDFTECVTKILKYFSIVHIHGNNHYQFVEGVNIPIVPEITFVNNKFIKERIDIKKFPINKLDSPNNHFVEDLFFHFK